MKTSKSFSLDLVFLFWAVVETQQCDLAESMEEDLPPLQIQKAIKFEGKHSISYFHWINN